MTSQLRCTPLLSGLLFPPPRKTAGKGEMTGLVIISDNRIATTQKHKRMKNRIDRIVDELTS